MSTLRNEPIASPNPPDAPARTPATITESRGNCAGRPARRLSLLASSAHPSGQHPECLLEKRSRMPVGGIQPRHRTFGLGNRPCRCRPVSYTHLRAHETDSYLVCRLLLEKKKKK